MTDLEKYLTELLIEADKTAEVQAKAITALTTSQEALETELKTIKSQLKTFETSFQTLQTNLENGLKKLE